MSARDLNLCLCLCLCLPLCLPLAGCGDEGDVQATSQRGGAPPVKQAEGGTTAAGKGSRRSGGPNMASADELAEARPDRPRPVLTRENFSSRSRDPFHNYMAAAEVLTAPEPVEVVRRQREVKLPEYGFEELRLIAIVNAGRGVPPTALFLSADSKSKSVKQGEYFSSAELLLASVNRDYIEIEVVDPELSPGWNLERGERKVIYLKDR